MSDEPLKQSFDLDVQAHLVVKNARGSVTIQPGAAHQIEVVAEIADSDEGQDVDSVKIFQDESGHVHVEAGTSEKTSRSMVLFDGRKPPKVHFTITAPQNTDIRAKTVSSTLNVAGFNGDLRAKTISGGMTIARHAGPAHLGTVSGKIQADHLSAATVLNGVSGKMSVVDSILPSLTAKTVSGKIQITAELGEGPFVFKSVSGSANLQIRPGAGAAVRSKSVSGRVKIGEETVATRRGRRRSVSVREVYELNGGGPEISFKSVSGSLRIESGDDPPKLTGQSPQLTQNPASKSEDVDRMTILKQIESGEISASEGIWLLG